jgi:hypothetical protein
MNSTNGNVKLKELLLRHNLKTLKLEPNLNCVWNGWAVGRVGYSLVTYLVDFVGSESIFEVLSGLTIFCSLRFAHLDWSGPDRFCKNSRFGSGFHKSSTLHGTF